MIDINELRRLAQAATPGHWHFWRGWVAADIDNDGGVIIVERPTPSGGKYQARVDSNFKFIAAANPAVMIELLDRLEEVEKERVLDEERIADLMTDLNLVGHENDKLRAEVKDRNEVIAMLQNELRIYRERERTMGWNDD